MIEFISGYGMLIGYFMICAAGALTLRRYVRVSTELFRKILHIILIGSIFVLTYGFKTWWVSVIAAIVFIIMVFPILVFAERLPSYSKMLSERENGEIKRSLIVVFSMFAILIFVCWGLLGLRYLVGIGLFIGRSSTQLADFIRRSSELIAIIVSRQTLLC